MVWKMNEIFPNFLDVLEAKITNTGGGATKLPSLWKDFAEKGGCHLFYLR